AVILVETFILSVNVQKRPHKVLQLTVSVFFQKEPVKLSRLAPLLMLSEILSHEEKLFARMAGHKGVAYHQVAELIIIQSRHLFDHGTFQMHNFVMGE